MLFCMADVYRQDYQVLLTHLRKRRKAARLTQTELAVRLGKSQSFVQKLETGERRLDVVQIRDMCLALEIDFLEFMAEFHLAVSSKQS